MHVLVLPSWYPTTEAPTNGVYFREQAQMLADDGMTVGVVYPEHQSLRRFSPAAGWRNRFQTAWTDETPPTLRRHSWNVWWRLPQGLERRVEAAVNLAARYIDARGRPDLVHAHSAQWAGAAAARIRERFGIPYVLTEHFSGFHRDAVFSWQDDLVREGFEHASALAAVSAALRDQLVERTLAPRDAIAVQPNAVDPAFFTRPPSPRAASPFRIATLARLHEQKRIDVLLDAFAAAFRDASETHLLVGGDGPARDELERQARDLGLADRTTFLGGLSRTQVRQLFWDANLFVLPSAFETFGVVLIEAMTTGLPVLATARGGPEDIVTPATGRHVEGADRHVLADALREMRASWSAYDPASIRADTVERFGPDAFLCRTRTLYRRALR
jgi:glycosyltransferase involved in cell wall biosynthesis